MLELIAAWVAAVAAVAAPVAHSTETAPTAGRTTLTAAQAEESVAAATPNGKPVKADPTTWRWACTLPMVVVPVAGPGVKVSEIEEQLAYPVAYLRGLGYDVTIGPAGTYRRDAVASERIGEVQVVATRARAEQRELGDKAARALTNASGRDALAATVVVDANPKTGELAGDIVLHELGHVLGLGHKAGTVMAESWDAPAGFDAAEVAAIDCR